MVLIAEYDLAKEANSREEFMDRPQWEFMLFYMKFKNNGNSSIFSQLLSRIDFILEDFFKENF